MTKGGGLPGGKLMNVPGEISKGLLTGVAAGFWSGLLGVSPGGILVPVISLTLGFPQRLAQAVSLVGQAPPTSLSGISSYSKSGHRVPLSWVAILACGFIVGGVAGAAWWVIAGTVVGLVVGTKGGAIVANKLPERNLKLVFVALILGLAIYMGVTA
jgi:uncharacterized membrane protein YfcA